MVMVKSGESIMPMKDLRKIKYKSVCVHRMFMCVCMCYKTPE